MTFCLGVGTFLLILGAHAQRGLGLSVCVSVTQHLTSAKFFRFTNDMTYNEGQKVCAVFSENAPLQS